MWNDKLEGVLRDWKVSVSNDVATHQEYSRVYIKRHYQIGISAVILSSIVTLCLLFFDDCVKGNTVTFLCNYQQWVRLVFSILTGASSILVGLQTFLKYQKRSGDHLNAANDFRALYNLIENTLAFPRESRGDPVEIMNNIRDQFDSIVNRAPIITSKDYILKTIRSEENADETVVDVEAGPRENINEHRTEIAKQFEKERSNVRRCNYGLPYELQYQLQRLDTHAYVH